MRTGAWFLVLSAMASAGTAGAIEIQPNTEQVQAALERGRAAAAARTPPNALYFCFGTSDGLAPHGFLMTKLGGLSVLSAHFALRGQQPSEQEMRQILEDPHLMVSIVLFGDRPDFAVNSYVLLTQGSRTIAPLKVRFDATADRSSAWPGSPAFRAKVIAFFAYADLDPHAKGRLAVFPRSGGEVAFDLDFAAIP